MLAGEPMKRWRHESDKMQIWRGALEEVYEGQRELRIDEKASS